MFARLFMFAFVVFIAHNAFASSDFQPRIPMDRQNEVSVEVSQIRGFPQDRRLPDNMPDWGKRNLDNMPDWGIS